MHAYMSIRIHIDLYVLSERVTHEDPTRTTAKRWLPTTQHTCGFLCVYVYICTYSYEYVWLYRV